MQHAKIIGSGMFVPPFIVTNEELCKIFPIGKLPEFNQNFDWSPEWIEKKLGIKERRFAFDFTAGKMRDGYYDYDLAEMACRNALQNAGIGIDEVDIIIYVGSTPEDLMPDPGPILKTRLKSSRHNTAASGRTAVGCGGFIYAMIEANSFIASGLAHTVLICASTCTSVYAACYYEKYISAKRKFALMARDRFNASLFGDGAGAVVLQGVPANIQEQFLATYWGSNGADNIAVFKGGSRNPATIESVLSGMHYFNLDALAVRKKIPKYFVMTVHEVLKKVNLSINDIDYFVFHQINKVVLKGILRRLNIPLEKTSIHVDRFGNLDTATLAVGFHEAKTAGKIHAGNLVLFSAVGAGLQYGSAIVRV